MKEGEKNSDDTKPKRNLFRPRIEKIRKEFNESRHRFSKSKINEIRRNFKTIINNGAFNNNYIQYESKGNKDKILTTSECLDMIRPYLIDTINDHKTQGEWKIQSGNAITEHITQGEWKIHLIMAINFISSKDSDHTATIHAKRDNVESMMGSETNKIIDQLLKSFLQTYQKGLQESMRGSEFIFDNVDALYYDLNKIILSRGGSYIDSPEWLKNKKATINP